MALSRLPQAVLLAASIVLWLTPAGAAQETTASAPEIRLSAPYKPGTTWRQEFLTSNSEGGWSGARVQTVVIRDVKDNEPHAADVHVHESLYRARRGFWTTDSLEGCALRTRLVENGIGVGGRPVQTWIWDQARPDRKLLERVGGLNGLDPVLQLFPNRTVRVGDRWKARFTSIESLAFPPLKQVSFGNVSGECRVQKIERRDGKLYAEVACTLDKTRAGSVELTGSGTYTVSEGSYIVGLRLSGTVRSPEIATGWNCHVMQRVIQRAEPNAIPSPWILREAPRGYDRLTFGTNRGAVKKLFQEWAAPSGLSLTFSDGGGLDVGNPGATLDEILLELPETPATDLPTFLNRCREIYGPPTALHRNAEELTPQGAFQAGRQLRAPGSSLTRCYWEWWKGDTDVRVTFFGHELAPLIFGDADGNVRMRLHLQRGAAAKDRAAQNAKNAESAKEAQRTKRSLDLIKP